MFRLYDARTGETAQITQPRGGLIRMFVGGPAVAGPLHPASLRALLLADLIRRNAEHRHGLSVVACLVTPGGPDDTGEDESGGSRDDGLRASADALNIRPAEQAAAASAVPGPQPSLAGAEIVVGAHLIRAGPVRWDGRAAAGPPLLSVRALTERGLDPLALRLAFLRLRYRQPADLSWAVLGEASQMLERWRGLVAQWAESPSKPAAEPVIAQAGAALDDDLDTPAALAALEALTQDPEIAPGSKFETMLRADQILALHLPRSIGRMP